MDSQAGACESGEQESGNQVITAFQRSLRGNYPFLQVEQPFLRGRKAFLCYLQQSSTQNNHEPSKLNLQRPGKMLN